MDVACVAKIIHVGENQLQSTQKKTDKPTTRTHTQANIKAEATTNTETKGGKN